MPLSYLPNIPQPSDQLSNSQGAILNNFGALQTWIDQNHVDYSSAGNQPGKHIFVQMPVQTGTPTGGFLAGEDSLFSQTSAVTTKPELVFVRGDGVAIEGVPQTYEITTYSTASFTSVVGGQLNLTYTYVWTRLPSGLLMLCGTQTSFPSPTGPNNGGNGLILQYPTSNFPGFQSTVFNVNIGYVTTVSSPGGLDVPLALRDISSLTQFKFTASANWNTPSNGLYFTAIGI